MRPRESVARYLVATVVALGPWAIGAVAEQHGDDVRALFEAYLERRHDEVRRGLAQIDDFGDFRTSVNRASGAWPGEHKAAFLLEAARAALEKDRDLHPESPGVRLFRDACAAVRRLPEGSRFELAWNAAAVALLDGPYATFINRRDHLQHVRHVDPAVRAMAEARPAERAAWHYAENVWMGAAPPSAETNGPGGARILQAALDLLTAAADVPGARGEAMLRRGALLAATGRVQDGLTDLAAVGALTDDAAIEYLALLFAARTLAGQEHRDEARQLYDAALRRWPAGRSAALGLAALDFQANQRQSAFSLTREALAIPPDAVDPWFGFQDGQWPRLEARIIAMRQTLR